jgi:hypothetical protein
MAFFFDAALGILAVFHLRHAEHYRLPSPDARPAPYASQPVANETAVSYSSPGKLWLGFKTYDPTSYGAIAQTEPSTNGSPSKNPFDASDMKESSPVSTSSTAAMKATALGNSGETLGLLLAGIVPFMCVFSAEPGEGVDGLLSTTGPGHVAMLGGAFGRMLGIAIAVMLGCLFAQSFSERRLLFAVSLGLWSMWLVTASQNLSLLCMSHFFAPDSVQAVHPHEISPAKKSTWSLRSAQFPKSAP